MTKSFFDQEPEEGADFKRASYFKFKEGDNRLLILTNPVHFRTAYNVGIVYEDSGYNDVAASKYSCYALDLSDGRVKLFEFSNTVKKQILTLAEGFHTKFDSFPMPYVINIKAKGAGTKAVKYSVIAMEPMTVSKAEEEEMLAFDPVEDILERKKVWQKKQMEDNKEYSDKANAAIAKTRKEKEEESLDLQIPPDVNIDDIE